MVYDNKITTPASLCIELQLDKSILIFSNGLLVLHFNRFEIMLQILFATITYKKYAVHLCAGTLQWMHMPWNLYTTLTLYTT